MQTKFRAIVKIIRPRSWLKNFIIFAALLFANRWHDFNYLLSSLLIFSGFCFLASAVYVLNDWFDRKKDRKHPRKSSRPLASGELSPGVAFSLTVVLILFAGGCIYLIPLATKKIVLEIFVVYFCIMMAYNSGLKNIFGLDILIVASGYMLRALAGGWGIGVPVTAWFKLSIFFLCLLLITGKRRAELVAIENRIKETRPILDHYSEFLLDRLIVISAAAALITYSLYAVVGGGRDISGRWMPYSILFVVYGLMRYFYLIYQKDRGEKPENLFLQDFPLQLCISGWVIYILLLFMVTG